MAMCSKEDLKPRCLPGKEESAGGSHIFRAYDSADGVMDLPADAPGRAHRRGCAELFLRHTAFLRSHSAVCELDEVSTGSGSDRVATYITINCHIHGPGRYRSRY